MSGVHRWWTLSSESTGWCSRYAPRLIVIYAGENDINSGATSEQVAVEDQRFVFLVHAKLPQARIVFVGVKPTIQRWSQIHRMRATNALIRAFCEHDDRLAFVDVDGPMLGWEKIPVRSCSWMTGYTCRLKATLSGRPSFDPSSNRSGSPKRSRPRLHRASELAPSANSADTATSAIASARSVRPPSRHEPHTADAASISSATIHLRVR